MDGFDRSRVFTTADGTSATFVSDATIRDRVAVNISQDERLIYPSGQLLLLDGTSYRIEVGRVASVRKRNGNTVIPTSDSLGRSITLTPVDAQNTEGYQFFDGLGRPVLSFHYDGSRWITSDTQYDALGRLTRVAEDPAGLAYQAEYAYDVLGNLRKVDQGGQARYFMYDSLGRLVRAHHPEQSVNALLDLADNFTAPEDAGPNARWTLGYSYDANDNVYQRTDACNIMTTYGYDNINRVRKISYLDTPPLTLFTYDFAVNGRGHPYADYEPSTSGTINHVFACEEAGRLTSRQTHFYLNSTA